MSATGRTLSDDPITMSKSHWLLSCAMAEWKLSGSPSPKNTMSGFITPRSLVGSWELRLIGCDGSLGEELGELSLLIGRDEAGEGEFWASRVQVVEGQRGMRWANTSALIWSAETRWRHRVHEAVANDPGMKNINQAMDLNWKHT